LSILVAALEVIEQIENYGRIGGLNNEILRLSVQKHTALLINFFYYDPLVASRAKYYRTSTANYTIEQVLLFLLIDA
jgi:hypothetical protein